MKRGSRGGRESAVVANPLHAGTEALSLATLCQLSGIHKMTVYRLMNSLERLNYVVRSDSRLYSLGPRLLYLGKLYEHSFHLSALVEPVRSFLGAQRASRLCSKDVKTARVRSNEFLGHFLSHHLDGGLSGAMHRNNDIGIDFFQGRNGFLYVIGLVRRQMESADHRMHLVDAGHFDGPLHRIHDTAMAA